MVVELFPHQQEAVNWMRDHHRTALFFSVGLGKTLPAIEAAVAPVLVVCPRHLRYMWETELQRYDCRVAVIEGTADQRFAMLNTLDDTWATIVNYEMVRLGPASSIPNAKFPQLFKKHWGTVIFDEAHRLRGRNAGWTKAARKLRTERLVMLTGTPHVKNWGDVWPLLRLIDKRQFTSYHHFVDTYLRTFVTPYGKDIGDPLDPAQFGDMLNRYVLRHTYESAGWPRPQYVEHDIPCELTSTTRQKMQAARDSYWVYRQRIEGFDVQGDPTYVNEYVPVSSAAMLALEMRMHIAHDPLKQEALLDLVADIFDRDCNAGIIVWTYYQEAAQVVYAALAKIYNAKVRPQYLHLVTGGVPDKERTAAVAQFKAHGGILVATLGALSEGENLQRATSQVFYECDYRGTVNQQAIGRSARTGQTEIVTVYNLVARRSPDERVLKVARHRTEAGQSPWKEIVGE